ncbi:hypothetical protein EVJ50_10720 [Synechococcus sp. RSCCF101]|nr:hypothetical protein EVJ50_10720 [Synechococcus sp. RSCCF101]
MPRSPRQLPRSSRRPRSEGTGRAGVRAGQRRPEAAELRQTTDLQRDFSAMTVVWQMLRTGAVRWIGEIGRGH